MNQAVISIIGAGNIGRSLISGLIANGYPAQQIWASNPIQEQLDELAKNFKIHTTPRNQTALENADIAVFTVKPDVLRPVIGELRPLIHRQLLISVAAGIRIRQIEQWLGKPAAIVRAMPNTPALVGCGASALYANPTVSGDQHELAESILRAVGLVKWIEHEELLDTVTALSGSGPAYFLLVMEALQQAACDLGLDTQTAKLLTLQTALGTAKMALESNYDLSVLRQQVTSKGGTTEAALKVLENGELRKLFAKAVTAAKDRAQELSEQLT